MDHVHPIVVRGARGHSARSSLLRISARGDNRDRHRLLGRLLVSGRAIRRGHGHLERAERRLELAVTIGFLGAGVVLLIRVVPWSLGFGSHWLPAARATDRTRGAGYLGMSSRHSAMLSAVFFMAY